MADLVDRTAALRLLRDVGQHGLGAASAPSATPFAPTAPQGAMLAPPELGRDPNAMHLPGGAALLDLQPPALQTIEELYRILPDDSWFQPSVSPANPIQFEIGSFTVPAGQHYWVFDYEFSVFRFSGVDAGDYLKAEAGRFTGVMGFDITVNGQRLSHLLYQLDPQPAQLQKQSFTQFGQANQSSFNRSAAQSYAAVASQGTSTLPVRRQVQGAANVPFTMVAKEQTRVALSIIIFRRVRSPIAAVEARHGGYLLQSTTSQALIQRMRPR